MIEALDSEHVNELVLKDKIMAQEQLVEELVTVFLKINSEPADAQVHALAEALGIDKETLEAKMYSMLSEDEDLLVDVDDDDEISAGFEIGADAEDVLDDPTANPDNQSLDEVSLNDGDPTDDDLGLQTETLDDGFDARDIGMGVTPTENQDALNDDGVPDISLD